MTQRTKNKLKKGEMKKKTYLTAHQLNIKVREKYNEHKKTTYGNLIPRRNTRKMKSEKTEKKEAR